MSFRRHLLETATLVAVAVTIALVSNTLASRQRKLKLPGDYPNATTVPAARPAETPSAPERAASAESSPATAQYGLTGSPSKGRSSDQGAAATPRGAGAAVRESSPSETSPGGVSPASKAADITKAFPPHPDKPYVEISGDDAIRLRDAGVPFLDARRTSDYEEGHVAGARPFSAWESDVDEKVMALLAERDGQEPLVVYCSGGDCEDSHLLAQKLWGAGFNDILVYRDGYPDWVKRGGPVRSGAKP